MGSRHVSRLALDPPLRDHLLANNLLTARDVLLLSPLDCAELLGLGWGAGRGLLQAVAAQITPPYATAWELLQGAVAEEANMLRTGLPTLDAALRRGLPPGSLTELVGPGGVGKSQACHMLAAVAALPREYGGLDGGVVYIDTERKFAAGRLAEMVRARAAEAHERAAAAAAAAAQAGRGGPAPPVPPPPDEALVAAALQRVAVMGPGSSAELEAAVQSLELVAVRHRARLVVLDSIAAPLRTDFGGSGTGGGMGGGGGGGQGGGSLLERQALVGRLAVGLKAAAEALRLPVLVTNQVTTRVFQPAAGPGQQPGPGGTSASAGAPASTLTAALGTRWAHAVNLRLVLGRAGERRFLQVAKSPGAPNVALEYAIGPTGLVELEAGEGGGLPAALLSGGNVLDTAILNEIDYGLEA